jgi:hypothetical protein
MNKLRVNDIASFSHHKTQKEEQSFVSNLFICAHFNTRSVQLYSNGVFSSPLTQKPSGYTQIASGAFLLIILSPPLSFGFLKVTCTENVQVNIFSDVELMR